MLDRVSRRTKFIWSMQFPSCRLAPFCTLFLGNIDDSNNYNRRRVGFRITCCSLYYVMVEGIQRNSKSEETSLRNIIANRARYYVEGRWNLSIWEQKKRRFWFWVAIECTIFWNLGILVSRRFYLPLQFSWSILRWKQK